ncbi:MAG TPA: hypothetical protein VFV38_24000 [Ktedonobacteraceae bacterium]|nr:hypothetical protein [Ktedonobacteraceae bacterium]
MSTTTFPLSFRQTDEALRLLADLYARRFQRGDLRLIGSGWPAGTRVNWCAMCCLRRRTSSMR